MTWESVRSPGSASPLRPPTGRPRAFASGLGIRSPSPRSHFVSSSENNYGESSCCDETYISQLSSRSDSRDRSLTETARGSNDAMSVLEKIKNDMNSLEQLRRTEFFEDDSENRHDNGERFHRDFSSPKQNRRSCPRSSSVDVPFRDSDGGESFASRKSLRSERSWRTEKKRGETERALGHDAETDELRMKVNILEEENERWQKTISVLREDASDNNRELNDELQEAKAYEAKLEKELLEVAEAAENDTHQITEKLEAATEQHENELRTLRDKFRSVEKAEKALQVKIGCLEERAIDEERRMELILQESEAENKKLQETIFLLDSELDGFRDIVDNTKQDNDEINKELEVALEEKQQVSSMLHDSEIAQSKALQEQVVIEMQLEESRYKSSEAKRALEDALDEKHRLRSELNDAESAHSQTKEAQDVADKLVKEATEESHRLRRGLEQATRENVALKHQLSDKNNNSEEVKIDLEKKLTKCETEISDLHAKSNAAKRNNEEQLRKTRDACEYEKETLDITLRAMEKEKEECTSELRRLSNELTDFNSQDAKTTAKLKASYDEHEKTKLELTKANDEVNDITTKLSQKSDELKECSRNLSQRITEAEATNEQIKRAKEEMDQKENNIQELMEMTDTLNQKVDELNTQAENYKSKMDQYETQLKNADASANGSENKSMMLNEEITSLQMELSRLTETIELAKNGKKNMQQSNNSISEKNKELILDIKGLEQKLKDTEKETRSYKEQITSALTSLDEMMKYIETSREEHDDIITSLEGDLGKALDSKHATETKMNRLVNEMKKENDKMKEKLKQAESSSVEYGRTITELETSIHEKASEATLLQNKIQILGADIDQLKESRNKEADERNSSNIKQLTEYEVKLEEEKIARAKLEEETRLTVEKMRVTERENVDLKESLQEARMRKCHDVDHKEQGDKIVKLNASLEEKAAEAVALEDKVKMLQAEVEKANERKSSNESEWTRQCEEYTTKLKEEKQLTVTKLSAAEKENDELTKSLEELRTKESELADVKETLKRNTKIEIHLRGELAHKKQQVTISESNEKHLAEHVASLEAQIDKLVSDYESKLEEMSSSSM